MEWKLYGVLGLNPGSATCQASVLFPIISLVHSFFILEFYSDCNHVKPEGQGAQKRLKSVGRVWEGVMNRKGQIDSRRLNLEDSRFLADMLGEYGMAQRERC